MIRVADLIARTLADHGITDVFLVTGGGAMHLVDLAMLLAYDLAEDASVVPPGELGGEDIALMGVGTARVATFHTARSKEGQRLSLNSARASMGWGFPSAIGATVPAPSSRRASSARLPPAPRASQGTRAAFPGRLTRIGAPPAGGAACPNFQ